MDVSKENYEGQRGILPVSPPRSHSKPNCLGTKQQTCKICEAKTDGTVKKNRQIYLTAEYFTIFLS